MARGRRDSLGSGDITLSGGTLAPRRLDIGSGEYVYGVGAFSETEGTFGPASTGELNLLGGTLAWTWESMRGEESSTDNGIRITVGSIRLGKGFHCDSGTNQATFGLNGPNPYDHSKFWQWSTGRMTVELKNTSEYGHLSAAGMVKLDGAFEAVAAPGASWAVGTQFRVLKSKADSISATQAFLDSYNSRADRLFNIAIEAVAGGGNGLVLTSIHHPGDANEDQAVNVGDLGILAGNWGQSGKAWATGDFTGDGWVNVGDLGVLAGNWGWALANGPGLGIPAPEPMSLVVLGLGALALIRRRR